MTEKISLDLILHSEVQELLDNFASVIHARVVLYDRDGRILRRGRSEGNSRFCTLIQERCGAAPCMARDREMRLLAHSSGKCCPY